MATKITKQTGQEQFRAHAKYIRYSPYKLRPIADVIRNKSVVYALNWLNTYRTQRATPIKKALESAVANARQSKSDVSALTIKEIRIDQGPIQKYFKPGAMGRAMVQRKRMSHISIILQNNVQNKEA
jgi:large subunit ribosomal protein L22